MSENIGVQSNVPEWTEVTASQALEASWGTLLCEELPDSIMGEAYDLYDKAYYSLGTRQPNAFTSAAAAMECFAGLCSDYDGVNILSMATNLRSAMNAGRVRFQPMNKPKKVDDKFAERDVLDGIAAEASVHAHRIAELLGMMPMPDAVETLNAVRRIVHKASPFRDEPVDLVTWVRSDTVRGNDYNPNTVAPPEMRLLRRSIEADGYTQPIVACPEGDEVIVVDGFHRHRVGKESPTVRKRVKGYLPITAIRSDRNNAKDRIASTIRHNRARGVHGVEPMREIVVKLLREGWTDEEVAKEVGMDADEVLRFKQIAGLPELFKNVEFSKAWE